MRFLQQMRAENAMIITKQQLQEFLQIMEREQFDSLLIGTQIFYRRDGQWYDGKGNPRLELS